jgi:hypothetical protein
MKHNAVHCVKERKNSKMSFFNKTLFALKKYPLSTYAGTPSGSIFPITTFFPITLKGCKKSYAFFSDLLTKSA